MEITLTKANKFRIDCKFADNIKLDKLPAKRYYKKGRCWMAPALGRNASFLLANFRDCMSPAAIEAAELSVARRAVNRQPFPADYRFKTTPMDHQLKALNYTWGLRRYALHMEMGTGKTKIAVDRLCAMFQLGMIGKAVVFSPVAVRRVWVREFATHGTVPVTVFIVKDMEMKRQQRVFTELLQSPDPVVFVCGAESLQQGFQKGRAYDTTIEVMTAGVPIAVVNDESHLFKGPDSNRSLNVEHLTQNIFDMGNMTGTPVSQGPLDLYMQFQILDPNILGFGDFYSFRNHFAEMGGYENREVVSYKNIEELTALIAPYTYTVTKDEVLDLPPKVMTVRYVTLSESQRQAYNNIRANGEALIQSAVKAGKSVELVVEEILAEYNMLQQISSGFVRYNEVDNATDTVTRREEVLITPDKNPKIKELLKILEENPTRQVLVWAKFKREIDDIVQALKDNRIGVRSYTGATSHEDRQINEDDFNAGKYRVFVSNAATGGTGLTLNAASLVVYYTNDFRLVMRLQSEDRCHRKGQDKSVLYVDLLCEDTKDDDIYEALASKQDVATYIRKSVQAAYCGAGLGVVQ